MPPFFEYQVRVGGLMQGSALIMMRSMERNDDPRTVVYVAATLAIMGRWGAFVVNLLNDPHTPRQLGDRCMFF